MRKLLPYIYLAAVFFFVTGFSISALARDKDREFKKERPHHRGNENSQRVTSITVGQPSYGGNGCPQGTMRAVFAPDNLSFSILFDQFVAEVSDSKPRRDVISCEAYIPIAIPDGMQMEITRVDFRGFVGLPDRAQAQLHSIFNFRGRGGDGDKMNLRFRFQGPVMDNYEISTDAMQAQQDTELSPCGGSFHLRVMNQLRLVNPAKGQPASVTIDSIDGQQNAVYYVNWRACSAGGHGKGRPWR